VKRRVGGLGLVALSACGPGVSSAPIVTSSGRPGFKVECWSERDACDRRAGRECPHGYAMLGSSEHYVPGSPGERGRMLFTETIACAGSEPGP
jgi:hypothetical protein